MQAKRLGWEARSHPSDGHEPVVDLFSPDSGYGAYWNSDRYNSNIRPLILLLGSKCLLTGVHYLPLVVFARIRWVMQNGHQQRTFHTSFDAHVRCFV
jgi:hypothetical protein